METGLVRDAQQTKQCVYSIPCDCGRCYIGETNRPLEARIKEHKYNLRQGLLEKSKLPQYACEEGRRICCTESKVMQIEPNTTSGSTKIRPNVSGRPSDQSAQFGHLSHLDPHYSYSSRSQKTTTPSSLDYMGNLCFYVATIQRILIVL
jgi:hypothetical protein